MESLKLRKRLGEWLIEQDKLNLFDLGRDAIHRGADGGQIEVALGVVEHCLGPKPQPTPK